MEKKTTQRIVGVSVVLALVVILLPLLFNKNETTLTQTTSVKAPPFPDQPVDTRIALTETQNVSPPVNPTPAPAPTPTVSTPPPAASPIASPMASNTTPVTDPVSSTGMAPVQASDKPSETISPSVQTINAAVNSAANNQNPVKEEPVSPVSNVIAVTNDLPYVHEDDKPKTLSHLRKIKAIKSVKAISASLAKKQMIAGLKKTAWAVQLGSFKEKANARRLADKLRTAGYKAFMREVKLTKGCAQTRVFIGPEFKQASANELSEKIEQQLKLHGFIVMYKPLEL